MAKKSSINWPSYNARKGEFNERGADKKGLGAVFGTGGISGSDTGWSGGVGGDTDTGGDGGGKPGPSKDKKVEPVSPGKGGSLTNATAGLTASTGGGKTKPSAALQARQTPDKVKVAKKPEPVKGKVVASKPSLSISKNGKKKKK